MRRSGEHYGVPEEYFFSLQSNKGGAKNSQLALTVFFIVKPLRKLNLTLGSLFYKVNTRKIINIK